MKRQDTHVHRLICVVVHVDGEEHDVGAGQAPLGAPLRADDTPNKPKSAILEHLLLQLSPSAILDVGAGQPPLGTPLRAQMTHRVIAEFIEEHSISC